MGSIGRKSSVSKVSVKTEKHTIVGIMAISCMLAANDEERRNAPESDRSLEQCPGSVYAEGGRFTYCGAVRIQQTISITEDIKFNAANSASISWLKPEEEKVNADNVRTIHVAGILKDKEVNGGFTNEYYHKDGSNKTKAESKVVTVHLHV